VLFNRRLVRVHTPSKNPSHLKRREDGVRARHGDARALLELHRHITGSAGRGRRGRGARTPMYLTTRLSITIAYRPVRVPRPILERSSESPFLADHSAFVSESAMICRSRAPSAPGCMRERARADAPCRRAG
jgi:hypothetical protein